MGTIGGDTPFTVLEGDINIASQRVSSKLLHLDSPSGVVSLSGSVGMDSTLDYQGTATVDPAAMVGLGTAANIVGGILSSRVGKITVPFNLEGTIDSPKVRPGKAMPSTSTTATSPSAQPVTPENAVDTIRSLFKKH
jgi:hypothetical protein